MFSFDIPKVPSPNRWRGRRGYPVRAIVIHKCEGNIESCLSHTLDPSSLVTYNYIIGERGEVVETVPIEDSAWHAGVVFRPTWRLINDTVNPNLYTIGVSLAGHAANATPFEQYLSLVKLVAYLCHLLNLQPNEDTIVFHREINATKTCPGYKLHKGLLIAITNIVKTLHVWKK